MDGGAKNKPTLKPDLLLLLMDDALLTLAKFTPVFIPNCASTKKGVVKIIKNRIFFISVVLISFKIIFFIDVQMAKKLIAKSSKLT